MKYLEIMSSQQTCHNYEKEFSNNEAHAVKGILAFHIAWNLSQG